MSARTLPSVRPLTIATRTFGCDARRFRTSFAARGMRTSPGRWRRFTSVPSKSRKNAQRFAARNRSRISDQLRNAERGPAAGRLTEDSRSWPFRRSASRASPSSATEIAVGPMAEWELRISRITLRPLCCCRFDLVDTYFRKFCDQITGPAIDVVFADVVPHPSHARGALLRIHLERNPYGIGHLVGVVGVDDQRVTQIAGRARKLAENQG